MINKNYRLIAFDIDGTILDKEEKVCSKLKQVVDRLIKVGYLFTLVTARLPISALAIASELGLSKEVIVLNGGLITNQQHEILYSRLFRTDRVSSILNQLSPEITINYYYEFDWIIDKYSEYVQGEVNYIHNIVKPRIGTIPQEVNKISLMGDNSLLLDAQRLLTRDESLMASFSHPNYLEINCKTISKFSGLAYYAKQNQISTDQIIAFGDGENDIPMLAGVGLGVAMGNALSHVKASAHKVIGNHFDQGVANYLEELIELGEL